MKINDGSSSLGTNFGLLSRFDSLGQHQKQLLCPLQPGTIGIDP